MVSDQKLTVSKAGARIQIVGFGKDNPAKLGLCFFKISRLKQRGCGAVSDFGILRRHFPGPQIRHQRLVEFAGFLQREAFFER